jgi:nucleoside-diphosphate-sugar epimerase
MGARLRVLVTGAGGFIGRNLLARAPGDWELVGLSRSTDGGTSPGLTRTPPVDEPLVPELARGFDVIVHLAGNANHGLAEREPWADLTASGVLAASILGRISTRRIVLLSSAAVYAGLRGRVDPGQCVRPPMAYALSKLYVEGLVASLVTGGRAESAFIVRLYNAFGPGERPGRLIPRVVDAARTGQPFTLTGDPSSLSDPVHVDDVVTCLVAAVNSGVDGTYDLCGGDPVPLGDQVARITAVLGLPAPSLTIEPREAETPIQFHSDPGPLTAALGIARPEAFASALRRYAVASGWITA